MSFKRAGDDHCALRLQKKQRVAELFAEDIPVNEVTQTRSGKYVCLVCPHNPVLDTMPMLSIHRHGRNHLTNMSIKMERDHNLSEFLQKRQQELYLKEASVNNEPLNTEGNETEVFNDGSETAPLLAKTRWLTKSVTSQNASKWQAQNSASNNAKRTGIGKTQKSQYHDNEPSGKIFKKNKTFFQSRVESKLAGNIFNKNTAPSASNKTTNKIDECFDKLSEPTTSSNVQNSKYPSSNAGTKKLTNNSPAVMLTAEQFLRDDLSNHCLTGTGDVTFKAKSVRNASVDELTKAESKRLKMEKQKAYLEMKKSGWLLDSGGKWIKDENVEFDSDEEAPISVL